MSVALFGLEISCLGYIKHLMHVPFFVAFIPITIKIAQYWKAINYLACHEKFHIPIPPTQLGTKKKDEKESVIFVVVDPSVSIRFHFLKAKHEGLFVPVEYTRIYISKWRSKENAERFNGKLIQERWESFKITCDLISFISHLTSFILHFLNNPLVELIDPEFVCILMQAIMRLRTVNVMKVKFIMLSKR